MRRQSFKKWTSLSLSALLLGGTFMPQFAVNVRAAQAEDIVISEVYGGGGNSGAQYKNDFIELYNPTDQDKSLEGWSVQYGSSTKSDYKASTSLSGTIKAHGYYLIQEADGSGGTLDLPTPDVSGNINLSATNGKVALVKNTENITVTDNPDISGFKNPNVVDSVGFGNANEYEGEAAAPTASNSASVERKSNVGLDPTKDGAGGGNGWDTNQNGDDFVLAEPNPQNSASDIEPELVILDPLPEGVTYIKDIRENDEAGKPKKLGDTVTIQGEVTVANNVLGSKTYYIQDPSGGINIYGDATAVEKGQTVKLTGTVKFYNGLTEIEPTSVEVIGDGSGIQPIETSIKNLANSALAEPLEGSLLTLQGKITNIPSSSGTVNLTLTDENGKAILVRVVPTTSIDVNQTFTVGGWYTITGILGQYATKAPYGDGYQIFPRNTGDVKQFYPLTLEHEAMAKAYKDTDIAFTATAEGADSVKLYYRNAGVSDYQSIAMTGVENAYTAVLPASEVTGDSIEYYIEAKNQSAVKTSGTAEAPNVVALEEDIAGPEVSGVQPANQTIVETQNPTISFQLNDPSGVDADSLVFLLDDKDVTANTSNTNNLIQLQLDAALSYGTHTLKVTVSDTKEHSTEYTWSFEVAEPFTGGNHYRGTTHNHTNISHDGSGSPEDAVKAGKAHGYDFFAFSDHSHDIDPELIDKDTVDHKGQPERTGGEEWKTTKELATEYTKDGDYVVFPAFEMTSTTWGHSNVFGTDNFIDRKMNGGKYQDLNQYYAWILTYEDISAQFNHPDMSANAFNNFMPYDSNVDQLFTMLEVGNGSGNYGYENAENKYFSALDLGWHVAPTYGEDNHDATWGQTMKRTVIVSKDLSQSSLLHSMKNLRVYMEEDPNFTLDVKANGRYMGSIVDSKSLTFDISGSDAVPESKSMPEYNYLPSSYKSDDRIQKVELLTNGSTVVDSIEPMTKDFTWNPEVTATGGQQWYVVRVTQMDGEKIYSSPIWTKEQPVDVRVSGLEVAGDTIVSGNPATLEAGISNLGTTDLTDLNVKFYYDEVNEANLIGTGKVASLQAKSVGKARVIWASPLAGSHKLIAVVDTPPGDSDVDNHFEKTLMIKEALGMKVMIDASHKNENTSKDPGTYKNNFTAFTKLVQQEGYTVVENTNPLTAENLADVKVLVMTHPQVDLTADENTAVSDFVKNGGSLLLADKSNHSNDPTINNDLLEQMGATIQINDDGIFDDTKEGNFWSNPATSPYAVRLHLHTVDNYLTDRADTVEYYSGSSLEKVGNQPLTNSETVTILASGNETTYQNYVGESHTAYDIVSDETGGSAIPAIASEVVGQGRIVVAGMNFMNDKQLDESYNTKGNDELALNSVNWLAKRDTVISSIADVRTLADEAPVIIEGTVTTGAGTFYDAFYLQDETGGIMAFHDLPDGALEPGDKVRVYGHLKTFENNRELEYNDFAQDVIKLGHSDPIVPKVLTTNAANEDSNQGLLIKVTGKVKSKYDDNSYIIDDGSGEVLVFTDGYIVAQTGAVPSLKVGDTLEAVGLTGKYAKGNRIRVRDTKELKGTAAPEEEPPTNDPDPTPEPPKADDKGNLEVNDSALSTVNGKSQVDEKKMVDAINSSKDPVNKVEINIKGSNSDVSIPVNVLKSLKENNKDAVIEIKNDSASYKLPVKELNLSGEITKIDVTVKSVEAPAALQNKEGTTVAPVIDFSVSMTIDGKEVKVETFNHYVSREIQTNKPFDKDKATAVRINEDGTFTIIPTVFYGSKAIVKSMTNSLYTIVEMNKTFRDVDNGANWAEAHIEKLASKGVIIGKTADQYDPQAAMTRGEFAAIISRSLALAASDSAANPFKDVSSKMAVNKNGEITAAWEAGILRGKDKDTFAPGETITREEAAVMISRAMDFVSFNASKLDTSKKAASYKDKNSIPAWASKDIEKMLQADIMAGQSNGSFNPADKTDRAQMAKIIAKFLEFVELMN